MQSALIPWGPPVNDIVVKPEKNSRPDRSRWTLVLNALSSPSPGRTLDRVYTTLGNILEVHANRAAHALGLGPHAVARKIKAYFASGDDRAERLQSLRSSIPPKLQKRCLKLMKYTLPVESSKTQCQAFKDIVNLVTLFPGLRKYCLYVECLGDATSIDAIFALWNGSNGPTVEEWIFWKTFAANCLADISISAVLEKSSVTELCNCREDDISAIEWLLIEHNCSTCVFSRALCIRYLGGILDLPEFWLNSGTAHSYVAGKLFREMIWVLKDIGVDILVLDPLDESERQFDYDGIDFLGTTLLAGISRWFANIEPGEWSVQPWYDFFRQFLCLLRRPRAAELVPLSSTCATRNFEDILPTIYQEAVLTCTIVDGTDTIPANANPLRDDHLTDLEDKPLHRNSSYESLEEASTQNFDDAWELPRQSRDFVDEESIPDLDDSPEQPGQSHESLDESSNTKLDASPDPELPGQSHEVLDETTSSNSDDPLELPSAGPASLSRDMEVDHVSNLSDSIMATEMEDNILDFSVDLGSGPEFNTRYHLNVGDAEYSSDRASTISELYSGSHNSSDSISILPSEPKIFYGREAELSNILKLFHTGAPRVAILCSGGMGKTSLARAVLHHTDITSRYAEHRYFVCCASATNKLEFAALIAAHLGLEPRRDVSQQVLGKFSSSAPSLLVLDDFEALWEPTDSRRDIEEFWSLLIDVEQLALIITMRGAERPARVMWTRPFLRPLKPLQQNAALQVFNAIAEDIHDPEEVDQVLSLTGNMPLAIDLFAHLVDYEGCSSVLSRWETEKTGLISFGHDKKSNLDVSNSLSLSSPRLRSVPHAQDLLSLLALLPGGISDAELLHSCLPMDNILGCKAGLIRTALAYSDDNKRLKALVPIREHMLISRLPRGDDIRPLLKHYQELLELQGQYLGTQLSSTTVVQISSNLANIHNLLRNGLLPSLPEGHPDLEDPISYTSHLLELCDRVAHLAEFPCV
ncbi:hypothetical protein MVEN_02359000 [Mycena venus]|uniref:Novel STAND NTPase 1 domain-containing protein n=1 Tax=Mycena venus TaxID=2733690 RepID=A0A8H7CEF0_9AGAR|nr:hypothetical protein MVEN_02359000 [Mycena venus]